MVPLDMFGSRTFRIALGTGFAFISGCSGLPFVFSLYLQGVRGLSSFDTGVTFLPMMLIGLALTPFSARIVERVGTRLPICLGLLAMAVGLGALALTPAATPLWVLSALMVLVGLGGPLTMPPMTAVLLNHVPTQRTGIASGVFNTSRQIGGAMARCAWPCWVHSSPTARTSSTGLRDSSGAGRPRWPDPPHPSPASASRSADSHYVLLRAA